MESDACCLRDTSVVVITLETSEVYVIVSLSNRIDTQVIYIDPTTGALLYNGNLGYDVFISQDEAINYVTGSSKWLCKSLTYAKALLGYSALGSFGMLLVATKLTPSIPCLPGGGCVYTVSESQWIKVLLQNSNPLGKGELKNIQELTDLDIDGKHYYCETRDITRPFPSRMPLQNPDEEFVWNGWFRKPFTDIGLPHHCVTLLQGFAECRSFGSSGQKEGIVSLTARRSRLHPGTRYLARGLNSCFSTGNEVECEQLVWVPRRVGQSVPFSTYIWRRGTIPIWWGADLKITAAEAEIYVSDRDPYNGSVQYYQRLFRRYDSRNSDVFGQNKKRASVPILCLNLLRNGEGKAESLLVEHFEKSLDYIRSTGKLPYTRIHLINYDWHANIKLKGEQQTIEGLWRLLKSPIISMGISDGDYLPSQDQIKDCCGEIICNDDFNGTFCLRTRQNGVVRYNCADSLDRTNAASYFGGLQVFVEQCRRLGISLDSDLAFNYQSYANSGGCDTLPPGWEKRSDAVTSKIYYIDHNTRTTTWKHPCPDKPWKRFDMPFEEFKRSTILSPIDQLADLFLLAGDIHATLYTGSKAMHSQILSIFNEEGGKFKQFSVAQNMKITLQRRYKNAVVDSSRQKQLEMFLGMRLFKHIPSIPIQPLHVLSRPPACFLKPVPTIFSYSIGDASLLSFRRKEIISVFPQALDMVQLAIYLSEPCHVCQINLTISHGLDDSYSPSTVDIRMGRFFDGLKLVVERASIPQCANGTNLAIPFHGPVSAEDMAVTGAGARLHNQKDTSDLSLLYDFEELEGELDFLTRVVLVTFFPTLSGRNPITIGEIEILGASLPWTDMFNNGEPGVRLLELGRKFHEQTNPFLSSIESKPFIDASLPYKNKTDSVHPDASASQWVDLLSGGSIHSMSVQPQKGNTLFEGGDLLDFLDASVSGNQETDADFKISTSHDGRDSGGAQQYIKYLKFFAGQNMEKKINFVEAMKLDVERLRLNLSAAERDRALLSIGTDPATINPNQLLDEIYMGRLCKIANNLALIGQASLEDKITASIGLEAIEDSPLDFWNISGILETCSGGMCEAKNETVRQSSSGALQQLFSCSQCYRKICKVCCAGRGAHLYANFNSREVTSNGVLCKECCDDIILDALIMDYVRVLISLRRSFRAESAVCKAVDEVIGFSWKDFHSERNQVSECDKVINVAKQLLKGGESIAEFPLASFLYPVETAVDSAPFFSLLTPLNYGSCHSYWRAPSNIYSVEFEIVLGRLSDVAGVILLVSPCGYSVVDAPTVQIWGSNKNSKEGSCLGKWDVQSLISSSPELYGPENPSRAEKIPRHIRFDFKNHIRCRFIWIRLRLSRPGSSSVNLKHGFDLLSLDENPFSEINRRSSFGGSIDAHPFLHAKRIIVVGTPAKCESDTVTVQGTDHINLRSILERAPQLNRFKVPIEAERLLDNDLMLEQFLSPVSPLLAGFRLDAFSAIKPRVMHSPSSDTCMYDGFIEDRYISPAILYIQVSALQEGNKMVRIGEYRLPEAKAGTPMYFDFPTRIRSRRISFKVSGDVAAFADEQDDSDMRYGGAVAAGLSLSNRIKLYHYADPHELGKWAALSAV